MNLETDASTGNGECGPEVWIKISGFIDLQDAQEWCSLYESGGEIVFRELAFEPDA